MASQQRLSVKRSGPSRRVLVTGAAGFLGSHLVDALLALGHEVVGLDNLQTGFLSNLEAAQAQDRFSFVHQDVCTPLAGSFDRIFHLACPASPPMYQRDPISTARTCFQGTLNVLELARDTEARVLLASTSEVYGDPKVHPQREDYLGNVNPTGPRACYDEGKRIGESLAFDFARMYGTEVRVARIFNTYGPRMHPQDGRVVSNFITQALEGRDITLFGDGTQTRSFCYQSDLIRGLLALMELEDQPGPVNLGNPHEVTVEELAQRVLTLAATTTGAAAQLVHHPLPQDDPTRRCPDISRARAVLDWQPKVGLETGLGATIAYFREQALAKRLAAE